MKSTLQPTQKTALIAFNGGQTFFYDYLIMKENV